MKRSLVLALSAAAAALSFTGAARAGHVQWSVGVALPPVGALISNAPVYLPAPPPLYVPAPVAYAPAPVAYAPRYVYDEPVVVAAPPPVVYRTPRPYVYERRVWERPIVYTSRDGRGWRGRDDRWVPPGHRDERRHPHGARGDGR